MGQLIINLAKIREFILLPPRLGLLKSSYYEHLQTVFKILLIWTLDCKKSPWTLASESESLCSIMGLPMGNIGLLIIVNFFMALIVATILRYLIPYFLSKI